MTPPVLLYVLASHFTLILNGDSRMLVKSCLIFSLDLSFIQVIVCSDHFYKKSSLCNYNASMEIWTWISIRTVMPWQQGYQEPVSAASLPAGPSASHLMRASLCKPPWMPASAHKFCSSKRLVSLQSCSCSLNMG